MGFAANVQIDRTPDVMRVKIPVLTLLFGSLWGLGCAADKSQVALTATVQEPALAVSTSKVGADATGGFRLVMSLGEYASEATEVSLGSFSVQRGEQELLSPLSLSGATFPVSLGIGKRVTLPLTFNESADPGIGNDLCLAPVQIRGTLLDSLSNDHPTVAVSATFMPSCD